MGRPRRQEGRRAQLISAAREVMVRDGLVGLRVREVAKEAGMSPASVLYYYPDSFALAFQALTETALQMQTERAAVAASVPDPRQRLIELFNLCLNEQNPGLWRALSEIPGMLPEHPELAELQGDLMADQIQSYAAAIKDGIISGLFPTEVNVYVAARALASSVQWASAAMWCRSETPQEAREVVMATARELLGTDLQDRATPRPKPAAATRMASSPAPQAASTPVALASGPGTDTSVAHPQMAEVVIRRGQAEPR